VQQRFQFCSFESLAIFSIFLASVFEFTLKNIFLIFTRQNKKSRCAIVQGLFFQFCEVGGLAIIHEMNEPNLARGKTGNDQKRLESCIVLEASKNLLSKSGDFILFF
jgi:hypothetical protein